MKFYLHFFRIRYTLLPLCLFLGSSPFAYSQIGGTHIYEFLNLSPTARVSGLGGNLITVQDDDVGLAFANPAAANASQHGALAFNHSFFLEGIQHGYVAYGHYLPDWKVALHGGIKYIRYGDFDRTDVFGNTLGTFNAAEYAVVLGASYALYDRLTLGANFKLVTSQFDAFNSTGLLGDLAAMYHDSASLTSVSLVFRNLGTQLTTYQEETREDVPFDLQLGISKKLRYLPFRLSIIYHHLHQWNILYDDPNAEEPQSFIGDPNQGEGGNPWIDNLARHFIFNGEFLFGQKENFRVRMGYNHFRHRELTPPNLRSLAGFSFGAGLKINRFRIDYGREIWHLAGGFNYLGISTNFSEFTKW